MPRMVDRTAELREAHDVLAEFYAERLAGLLDAMPVERSLLGLFTDLVSASDLGGEVADVGCGTGRLAPYLIALGLTPHGVDLSPEMVRVARREVPGADFRVGDIRALPFDDASLAGVVGWYSLMYLAPDERAAAYAELARVLRPGGHLTLAFKVGDGSRRRGGTTLGLGIGFDIYWFSPEQIHELLETAGFRVVLTAERPAEPDEPQPQGYVIARKE